MAPRGSSVDTIKGVAEAKGGRGQAPFITAGEYPVRVEEVVKKTSSAGNEMYEWTLKGLKGEAKGKTFFFHTNLEPPDLLWKLRQTLVALGVKLTKGSMEIDRDELAGLTGTVIIEDDEYQGKPRSKVRMFTNGEEVEEEVEEEEEEEEEEVEKKPAKAAKKKAKPPTNDEIKDMDEDELESLVEKHNLDVDLSAYKTLRRKATAVIAAMQDE